MMKILLIEDDSVLIEIIKSILVESKSMRVDDTCDNLIDACQLCELNHYDAALVDVVLVGKEDGVAVAKMLFDKYKLQSVLMTGYLGTDVIERSLVAQPLGFLAKPFNFGTLVPSMEQYLSRRK